MSLIDAINRVRGRPFRFDLESDPGPDIDVAGKRVLLVYLFPALGDSALLAPVVKALAETDVEKPIGLLIRSSAARIWKHLDLPVKVHTFPDELVIPEEDKASKKKLRSKEVKEATAKLVKQLTKKKYDIAVDLTFRDEVDARRWLLLCGAETRLGWTLLGETAKEADLTWATPDERHHTDRHWSRYLALPLRCLGVQAPDYDITFGISKKANEKATELWGKGPRVLLVPGAQSTVKRWHSERFEEVGQWVAAQKGTVVVCGSPDESKLVKAIVKSIGDRAKTYTKKDLGTLLALIRSADVVVSNDTGPMHFSFLSDKPTISIFTYMPSTCWGPPTSDPKFVVLNAPESEARADVAQDAQGVWTRAVIHYLSTMLEKYKRD